MASTVVAPAGVSIATKCTATFQSWLEEEEEEWRLGQKLAAACPKEFMCPISLDIMSDPIVLVRTAASVNVTIKFDGQDLLHLLHHRTLCDVRSPVVEDTINAGCAIVSPMGYIWESRSACSSSGSQGPLIRGV